MKKFFPYIFILIILANIFAPFSINFNGNIPNIENNYVEAIVEGVYDFEQVKDAKVKAGLDPYATTTQVSNLPACSFTPSWLGGGKGTFVGCIAQGLYYVLYVPSAWLFAGSGQFFDWMFNYSIDDASYKTSFVTEGWQIVRDLCNVFFIFILLYVAFALILDLPNIKAKDMLVNVIIIGLLINFSMFFAKVIIDSSNILARVFYNSQTIEQKSGNAGLGDEISLSQAVVDKLDPQEIVKRAGEIQVEDPISEESSNAGANATKNLSAGGFTLVTLLATIVNIIGIFVFISVALVFVARVIGLYFILIFAPFAFLSYTVPALSKIKMMGWQNWWGDLAKLSFVAPLFMFMLYLIILFLEKGFGDIVQKNNTGVKFVLSVIIPFVFIMVMLMMAKRLAKEYSGEMGKAVTGVVNKVAGVAGGVALGAGAVALRGTVGRAATAVGRDDKLNQKAAEGKSWAVGLKKLTNVGEKASFDVRKSALGAGIAKETGADLDTGAKYIGLGTKRTEGGYTGYRDRQIKKEETFGKTLGVNKKTETNIKTDIETTKSNIETEKTNIDNAKVIMASNAKTSNAYKNAAKDKAEAEKRLRGHEKTLSDQKEALETNKVGRAREYYQYKRRQTGRITEPEKDSTGNPKRDARGNIIYGKRDQYGNITEYAKTGDQTGEQIGKQILRGFKASMAEGGAIGIGVGALTMMSGAGFAAAAAPAVISGLSSGLVFSARRAAQTYSGTYNRKIGDTASESPKEK